MVVREVLLASGLRDELALVLSVCSPSCLSYVDKDELLGEVRNFTDLLVELNRISLSEQGQMGRGFLDFVATYRRESGPAGATADCAAIDLLRC